MTSLAYVDSYGAPDYGVLKGRPVAVILHTTEGNPGRAGALATARWQATSGNSSGGSYHFVVGSDGDVCTAVRTVPLGHIAGSISTRRDAVWIGDDDADLRRYMGAAAVADPNAYVIAISMAGYTATFEKNGWPQATVDGVARLIRMVEQHFGIPNVYVAQHYRFQTNRSDPGRRLTPLVMAAYQRLYGGGTAPAPDPKPASEPTPAPAPNQEEEMLPTRRKAQVWKAHEEVPVHQSPDDKSPVIAKLADGTYFPTIQEQAELRDGKWVTTGPWRTVVLADDRTGYVHRTHMDPVAEGAAAFDKLNRGTLYEVDTAHVPAWPLAASGITQAQLDAAKLNARDQALRDAEAALAALK